MNRYTLLLVFTSVIIFECYGAQSANQTDEKCILDFLEKKQEGLVFCTSKDRRVFRGWVIAEKINIPTDPSNLTRSIFEVTGGTKEFIRLKPKDSKSPSCTLSPACYTLLQHAYTCFKEIYFFDDNHISECDYKWYVVNAKQLSDHLNSEGSLAILTAVCRYNKLNEIGSKAVDKKIHSLLITRFKATIEHNKKSNILPETIHNDDNDLSSEKNFAKLGKFTVAIGVLLGIFYWAHLCLLGSEYCVAFLHK